MSKVFFEAFDKFFTIVIFPPFIIGYWRGTYNLLDIFLYKNNVEIRAWIFLIVGTLGNFILTVFQNKIRLFLNPKINKLRFYIGSRVYTIISSILCVNSFRSIWHLFDLYITTNVQQILILNILLVLTILGACKGVRNILDKPHFIVKDGYESCFYIPTRYQMSVSIQIFLLTK